MEVLPFVIIVFIVIVVIAVAVLLFGGWIIVSIFRLLARGLFGSSASGPGRRFASPPTPFVRCQRQRCHANNPAGARFCRRCGVSLHGQPQPLRHVAMW